MGKLAFRSNDRPTIGIELELGIVDAQTMSLTSAIQPLIELLPEKRRIDFKPELMQCCIEVISGVCDTVADAETDLTEKLVLLEQAADQLNLGLWWGATHPFSSCHEQQVTPDPRYQDLVELLQEMARRLVTFGLHVHVGAGCAVHRATTWRASGPDTCTGDLPAPPRPASPGSWPRRPLGGD